MGHKATPNSSLFPHAVRKLALIYPAGYFADLKPMEMEMDA